jgi:hypothetical protein
VVCATSPLCSNAESLLFCLLRPSLLASRAQAAAAAHACKLFWGCDCKGQLLRNTHSSRLCLTNSAAAALCCPMLSCAVLPCAAAVQDDPSADISVDGYMYGELAVARAIGSAAWKRDPSKRALIPTPELVSIQLQPDDDFVVIATDGLWDKVDNTQVDCCSGLAVAIKCWQYRLAVQLPSAAGCIRTAAAVHQHAGGGMEQHVFVIALPCVCHASACVVDSCACCMPLCLLPAGSCCCSPCPLQEP